jgi:type I restriction enzyme M protein
VWFVVNILHSLLFVDKYFLETQRAIVAEIEAEQALVAANRELIARMEKKIKTVIERIWGEDSDEA